MSSPPPAKKIKTEASTEARCAELEQQVAEYKAHLDRAHCLLDMVNIQKLEQEEELEGQIARLRLEKSRAYSKAALEINKRAQSEVRFGRILQTVISAGAQVQSQLEVEKKICLELDEEVLKLQTWLEEEREEREGLLAKLIAEETRSEELEGELQHYKARKRVYKRALLEPYEDDE